MTLHSRIFGDSLGENLSTLAGVEEKKREEKNEERGFKCGGQVISIVTRYEGTC
jgi:hypothetical protein